MKTKILLNTKFLYCALVIGLIGFFSSVALADTAAATSPAWALTSLIEWVPLISALLSMTQAVVAREMTVTTGFWHSPLGHGLLVAFGALIGAGTSFLANGQWTKQAAIAALTSAAGAFAGAWRTSGKDPSTATATTPVITQAKALLPLAFALLLTVAGCKTTLGKCLLGGLPATLETVVADVLSAIYSPSSVVSDIEGIGTTPDVACVVAAVEQYIASKTAGPSGTVKPASLSPQYEHALDVLHQYMARHPATACRSIDVKRVVERPKLAADIVHVTL